MAFKFSSVGGRGETNATPLSSAGPNNANRRKSINTPYWQVNGENTYDHLYQYRKST